MTRRLGRVFRGGFPPPCRRSKRGLAGSSRSVNTSSDEEVGADEDTVALCGSVVVGAMRKHSDECQVVAGANIDAGEPAGNRDNLAVVVGRWQ